jgi:hypothetical protein
VIVDPDISPSQDGCYAFQEYAIHCVSQSNSKKAREERLKFLNEFLLNEDGQINVADESESILKDILVFYHLSNGDLIQMERFFVPNVDKLIEVTNRQYLNEVD